MIWNGTIYMCVASLSYSFTMVPSNPQAFRCLYYLILSYWISLERYLLNCFFFNQQHEVPGRKCFEGKFLFLLFDRELLWKLLTSYNTEFKDTHILEEVCHVITVGLVVLYPTTTDKNQLLQILLFDGKT